MSAALELRWAGPADAETIHGFICELAAYEREPGAVEVSPQVLRAQLEEDHPPFECLIAEEGGEALGFALFFHNYSTWKGRRGIYLEDLYVPPRHRGRGIGGALLRRLAQLARERDCGRLEWAVLKWNQPAIDFYRRAGAIALDGWNTFRLSGAALERCARG